MNEHEEGIAVFLPMLVGSLGSGRYRVGEVKCIEEKPLQETAYVEALPLIHHPFRWFPTQGDVYCHSGGLGAFQEEGQRGRHFLLSFYLINES